MGLEAGFITKINELDENWPTNTDPRSEGDDHLRHIKRVLRTTFPNVNGIVTASHTDLSTFFVQNYCQLIRATSTSIAFPQTAQILDATFLGASWTKPSPDVGLSSNTTTGEMTVNTTGMYRISFSTTIQYDAVGGFSTTTISVYVNAILQTAIRMAQRVNTTANFTGEQIHGSFTYLRALTATDIVTLRFTGTGGGTTVTLQDLIWNMERVA